MTRVRVDRGHEGHAHEVSEGAEEQGGKAILTMKRQGTCSLCLRPSACGRRTRRRDEGAWRKKSPGRGWGCGGQWDGTGGEGPRLELMTLDVGSLRPGQAEQEVPRRQQPEMGMDGGSQVPLTETVGQRRP